MSLQYQGAVLLGQLPAGATEERTCRAPRGTFPVVLSAYTGQIVVRGFARDPEDAERVVVTIENKAKTNVAYLLVFTPGEVLSAALFPWKDAWAQIKGAAGAVVRNFLKPPKE